MTPRLGPRLLPDLPAAVARPGYDRSKVTAGIAHIGVGAFHRSHQAEFTDDLLTLGPGPWGIAGINLRPPRLSDTLGAQHGLYTRLKLDGPRAEARVIGSILTVTDSQSDAGPALQVLTDPAIGVVTVTVTEKGYCHRPVSGELDWDNPGILADLSAPQAPITLPGTLVRALELRRAARAPTLTILSCDNVPGNGHILRGVVVALAARRNEALAAWVEKNIAFPATMVDRIAPAVTSADLDRVERDFGYRDGAAIVCEPFRQWVIEDHFAGPMPAWDRVGAGIVANVEPYELLKMRVLNAAQTTLAALGALCGLTYTFDDMADAVLSAFVERMLVEEVLPTLRSVPGLDARTYVKRCLSRLRNTAIPHTNHQICTDASQKIVQRILNPAAERLRRGQGISLLAISVAAVIAYLIRGAPRFGAMWTPDDPIAAEVAAIAERTGADTTALVSAITGIRAIFASELAASELFKAQVASALGGLLGPDPRAILTAHCRNVTALP